MSAGITVSRRVYAGRGGSGALLVVGAHAPDFALAAESLELLLGAILDGADVCHRHAVPVVH